MAAYYYVQLYMHEQIQTLIKPAKKAVKKVVKKAAKTSSSIEEESPQVNSLTRRTLIPSPKRRGESLIPWNPDQYHKFQSERAAPFYDLLALVDVRPHLKVVDLGCGTGELTRQLADKLPESNVIGLDASQEMLDKAASFSRPSLIFERGDQATLTGNWDLIFSDAALQWSENHTELIPYLFDRLKAYVIEEFSNARVWSGFCGNVIVRYNNRSIAQPILAVVKVKLQYGTTYSPHKSTLFRRGWNAQRH